MRWNEIVECQKAQDAVEHAAAERRKREQIDTARRAKADASRKYQSEVSKANSKISTASDDLRK